MTVLLQVSDAHFGTEQAPVQRALAQLVHEQAPSLVMLSGDITQRATPAQFDAARRFADGLAAGAVRAIPGNHDIPLFNLAARFFSPYGHYARAFGEDLEPSFENERLLVLTLNTTRWYRHKNGEVSPAQIERVARRLERATPDQLRVVVVHQPVAVTRPEDETNLLRGRVAAVHRWAGAGVDLVMGGHIHLPYVLPLHEQWGTLARRVWAVQAGTAVSSRVRGNIPNSVNLVRHGALAARACVVERWDYDAARGSFEPKLVHELSLSGAR